MALWGYAQGLIVGALSLAGFAGGRFHRLAPRAAAAHGGLVVALRAAVRAGRRPDGRRRAGLRPGADRVPAAPPAGRHARRARRHRRRRAGGVHRARAGVDRRRGGAADARRARAARADPALRDPARAQRAPAAVGADPARVRPLRPVPADRRARRPTCGRPTRASPATRRCARPVAAWSRCSGPPAGSACRAAGGSPATGGRHERPRRGRPGRHDRAGRRRGLAPRRRGDLVRLAQRPRAAARPGPERQRRRCGCDEGAAQGTSAAILGFPENGPYDVAPARLGQHLHGGQPGRLRPRAGAPRDHGAARARAPGNSGGPVVDGRGRVVATIFAATVSDGGRSGYGVPDSVVAMRSTARAAPSTPGPCAR